MGNLASTFSLNTDHYRKRRWSCGVAPITRMNIPHKPSAVFLHGHDCWMWWHLWTLNMHKVIQIGGDQYNGNEKKGEDQTVGAVSVTSFLLLLLSFSAQPQWYPKDWLLWGSTKCDIWSYGKIDTTGAVQTVSAVSLPVTAYLSFSPTRNSTPQLYNTLTRIPPPRRVATMCDVLEVRAGPYDSS